MTARVETPLLRTVGVNGSELRYLFQQSDTRRLSISVHPDLSVTATAPLEASPEQVDARVLARTGWIRRQLRHFERMHPLPVRRRYVSGETHLYLGRQYRIRISAGRDGVKLSGGRLLVTMPSHPSRHRVQRLLDEWYRARASEIFERRLVALTRRFSWLGRGDVLIRVRLMTRRWGSCGPRGTITLNVDLVKAPVSCIDYVVTHELCHRLELKHSRRFFLLLRRAVPDWERARERLNMVIR